MTDLQISIKKNPAAWIYVMIPPAVIKHFDYVVAQKRAQQNITISRAAALSGMNETQLKDFIENSFVSVYGYSTKEAIGRLYQGKPITKISGIYGDDEEVRVDTSAGEIDPMTGLPITVLENAEYAEHSLGATALPNQGAPASWTQIAVPTLGVNQSLSDFQSQNANRAWTVKDPGTGNVYTQTYDQQTGNPIAIYNAKTGAQYSVYNPATGTFQAATTTQKVGYIFDQISSGLNQVAAIIQQVLGMIMQMVAAKQATQGQYGLYNMLNGQSVGTQNAIVGSLQSDDPHFGGTGAGKAAGDSSGLITIALVGLGIYLLTKK